jgi:4-carboxymuconolactone decarboxylase
VRLPLPRREQLDDLGRRIYDSLADPKGGAIRGLRALGGIPLHSPELSRHARPLNRYLRHEAGLGGHVRELAILTTARELGSQLEWAAHEPEALSEGISPGIIQVIKHRKDTNGLDEADAIVIELGREILGARKVAPRLLLGHYASSAGEGWSTSSPSWAIMLGQQRFSSTSTCNSIEVQPSFLPPP